MADDAPPPASRGDLRAEVMSAIAEAVMNGLPPERIRPSLLERFPQVPKATLYRWIAAGLTSGTVGRRIAERRISAGPGAREVTGTALPIAEYVTEIIEASRCVLRYARGDDPDKPRNPKLTLQASMAVAGHIKTALAVQEALVTARRVEDFHAALIREIEKESPELAGRVMHRLRALTSQIEV